MIEQVKVNDEQVKPGALISLLQKSIKYMELESHVKDVSGFAFLSIVVGWDRSRVCCSFFTTCPAYMCFWEAGNR